MNHRFSNWFEDSPEARSERKEEIQRIDQILNELLDRYERRFPSGGKTGVKISIVETPIATV